MLKEIVLDTETTGLDPKEGHRLVEIGCVEMVGGRKTGKTYQAYINPERPMPPDATRIHGITDDFLKDKPKFQEVVEDFLKFIEGARLVIHNAGFDMKFLNWELQNADKKQISTDMVTDTLDMARRKFPGSPASLDALCKRFSVSNDHRNYHGALLDSELLAEVYIALTGGKQASMEFATEEKIEVVEVALNKNRPFREPRNFPATEAEKNAHAEFIKTLKNPIWSVIVEDKAA